MRRHNVRPPNLSCSNGPSSPWNRRVARTLLAVPAVLSLVFNGCFETITVGAPHIAGASPSSIPQGSSDTTLTINGENFKSAVARAFDVPLPDNSVSNTQIVTTLPADMLTHPGTIPLTVVNVEPGGNLVSNVFPIVVTSGTSGGPVLALSKTHTGNFTQGGTGSYTIVVSNTASAPTDGSQVIFTDTLPSGLSVSGLSGTGWNCNTTMLTCDRTDVLDGDASFPPITVNVGVATNAPATVTNQGAVSGGGSTGATASDPTNINPPAAPMLAIAASAVPSTFSPGGTGSYTINTSNLGEAPTSGIVTMMVTPSSGEMPASLSGTGWTCTITNLKCTNSAVLAPGASYSPITFTVAMGPTLPPNVTTTFTISGGGSASAMTAVTTPSE